jgi:NADP-dependent 3-hydroxy acid dehydrogenase YdfG
MGTTSSGKWNEHVVLITGASSGIGAALSIVFAQQGARVALAARRLERLQEVQQKINDFGGHAFPVLCDVTQVESVQNCIDQVVTHWGKLDVVVANAGFGVAGSVLKLSNESYQLQFETNIFGVLNTLKLAYPHLESTQGRAVIVGSVNGYVSLAKASAYAMSKFAVRALAQSLWIEWKRKGVSTTLIEPGFVDSEIRKVNNQGEFKAQAKDPIPTWLMMPADQAARKIAHAIYKRKREQVITFHGQVIVCLSRFLPGLTYWILSKVRR